MTIKEELIITKTTFNKRVVIYHKSANDKGALIMVCERDEEHQPSVAAR
jgi:hypothetical protein